MPDKSAANVESLLLIHSTAETLLLVEEVKTSLLLVDKRVFIYSIDSM